MVLAAGLATRSFLLGPNHQTYFKWQFLARWCGLLGFPLDPNRQAFFWRLVFGTLAWHRGALGSGSGGTLTFGTWSERIVGGGRTPPHSASVVSAFSHLDGEGDVFLVGC